MTDLLNNEQNPQPTEPTPSILGTPPAEPNPTDPPVEPTEPPAATGAPESIDGFEIVENSAQYNGVYVPTIRPKNGSTFLPWALSKPYYEDVIKHMIVDMRDTKLKEIGI